MSSMIETGVSSNDVLSSAVHDQQARTSMNCQYHMRPVVIAIIISLKEGKEKKTMLDTKLKETEKAKNKKIEA